LARLEEYRKKRNFERTPEPAGRQRRTAGGQGGVFVVHKHAARRLHYDLRLEHDGVFESWAVPKGPSLDPGEKRLAVKVEDHPLEYGDFEGVIPAGEYGAGTVMLWDRGRWRAKKRSDGHLDFELEGHKLRGAWTLVRTGNSQGGVRPAKRGVRPAKGGVRPAKRGADNWLLIKRSEGRNRAEPQLHGALPEDASVATGRTMKQIAADRSRVWSRRGEAAAAGSLADPAAVAGAAQARLPEALRPQLATLAATAPQGDDWIHEIKFDGYRIIARIQAGHVRLQSRNGKAWTDRFPEIATLLANLPVDAALLDGEVVAMAPNGTSSFRHLQEALSSGRTNGLSYQVFDLLHLNGFDLTAAAQLDRKRTLASLLEAAGFVGSARVRYTDHITGKGPEFFAHACRLGLEGIVCKRTTARYSEGRNKHWLKVKCKRNEELVVGGFTDPAGSRSGFGALLLGYYQGRQGRRLTYAGRVGTGFSDRQLRALHRRLRALEIAQSPFETPPDRGLHWVKPELVAEVEFTEWTREGLLRHPTFRGLREDRDPQEIRMERAATTPGSGPGTPRKPLAPPPKGSRTAPAKGASAAPDKVAGVRLTNPERVLYPEQGITKLDLAHYYEEIADWILPQLQGRPLSLLRCPQGHNHTCFFQKHPQQTMASHIPRVKIREKSGIKTYLYAQSVADLVALVQAGTLELHVWGSRVDDLERPDIVVFDLDPAPDLAWQELVRTARDLRERLGALGLEAFVRTTGGKGLHVVVPLVPERDWDEVKAFAHGVARGLADDEPRRFTTNMSKARRHGRIFLDYLRNGRGATAIASYSTRAREGAPVAVPLRWNELSGAMTGSRYDIYGLRRRLNSLRADPWQDFDAARRPLTREMLKAVAADRSRR
jgi:bifunctional non-homologous end joining protein LigD